MAVDLEKLLALPPAERLEIAQALWGSLEDAPDLQSVPLLPWQLEELERAIAEHEADPGSSLPLDEAITEIRKMRRKS